MSWTIEMARRAGLLHDIGKGRPEDHSIIGAQLARDAGLEIATTSMILEGGAVDGDGWVRMFVCEWHLRLRAIKL